MADPADRKVKLGVLQVDEKVKRAVRIVNNSLATMDFNLTVTPAMVALQNSTVLSVVPNSLVTLKPKASTDVIVQFSPKTRIPKFSEEVGGIFFVYSRNGTSKSTSKDIDILTF